MRLFLLVCVGLVGCVDWNRGPSKEDLVASFVEAEGLADLEDCGSIDDVTCEGGEEATFTAGAQCLADAFASCTPARLDVTTTTGDGGETHEVLIVHPEGDACAVQRFVEPFRADLAEQHCADLSVAVDEVCVAPEAAACADVCGGEEDACEE